MNNQDIISIVSIVVDIIAVFVSIWACFIAKKANQKSEEAIKMTQMMNNKILQNGTNNLTNTGNLKGSMIGEQYVNIRK